MEDDLQLLKEFSHNDAQHAFETLVQRYTPMVFNSALRRTGPAHAEDITQSVFIMLARKASRLCKRRGMNVAGWLFTATRYASLQAMRSETRRRVREDSATKEHDLMQQAPLSDPWEQVSPLLDAAIDSLNKRDRLAIVLRFFDNASYSDIGQQMGLKENAANKRVERGVEKLTRYFGARGVKLSGATFAALVLANGSTTANAAGLGASCAAAALSGTPSGMLTSVSTLVSQTSKAMLLAQAKAVAITVTACTVTIGASSVGIVRGVVASNAGPRIELTRLELLSLTYMGRTQLQDGSYEFQINDNQTRGSHFAKIGEQVRGYEVSAHSLKYVPTQVAGLTEALMVDCSELTLTADGTNIVLVKDGRKRTAVWLAEVETDSPRAIRSVHTGSIFEADGHIYEVVSVEPETKSISLRPRSDGSIVKRFMSNADKTHN